MLSKYPFKIAGVQVQYDEAAAAAVEASMRAAGVTEPEVLNALRPPPWQTLGPRLALQRGQGPYHTSPLSLTRQPYFMHVFHFLSCFEPPSECLLLEPLREESSEGTCWTRSPNACETSTASRRKTRGHASTTSSPRWGNGGVIYLFWALSCSYLVLYCFVCFALFCKSMLTHCLVRLFSDKIGRCPAVARE